MNAGPDPEHIDDADGFRLATVLRLGGPAEGLVFYSAPEDLLQVGLMRHAAGHAVPAHTHAPVRRETVGTAEVLLVLEGMVRVDVYRAGRLGGEEVRRVRLGEQDAVILYPGSVHAVCWLTPAKVFEVKSGPYAGAGPDKGEPADA